MSNLVKISMTIKKKLKNCFVQTKFLMAHDSQYGHLDEPYSV